MKIKFKKDNRDKLWAELELKIQKRGSKKDKKFVLTGKWKKLVRNQEGLKIFKVDGEWVRNNLSVIFGNGGHGYVHEFIPANEIWVDTHHFENDGRNNIKKGQKLSPEYFDSTVIHEISELKEMKKGLIFWKAHQIALQKEKEAGILKNPYKEIN